MKKILMTSIALLAAISSYAQNPDKALARVRYTFTHVWDTTQRDKPHIENMLLITGKNASVYTSYDKLNQAINTQKQIQEQMKNQTGNNNVRFNIKSETKVPLTQVDYFFFANEHKMITKEKLFNNYLVEEPAPQIDWKILKDTMSFSGISCQKATASFKGRNWVAWFATELPFQSGPWKLNGLPGLIIEAYDTKKEVKFEFAGLENVKDEQKNAEEDAKITMGNGAVGTVKIMGIETSTAYLGPEIKLPADAIKTTRKELDKLRAARDKDPQGFLQAQMAANGMQGSFKMNNNTPRPGGTSTTVKATENNPIEILQKK